jgi:hypothetical protein
MVSGRMRSDGRSAWNGPFWSRVWVMKVETKSVRLCDVDFEDVVTVVVAISWLCWLCVEIELLDNGARSQSRDGNFRSARRRRPTSPPAPSCSCHMRFGMVISPTSDWR